jgi:hypothetical protein
MDLFQKSLCVQEIDICLEPMEKAISANFSSYFSSCRYTGILLQLKLLCLHLTVNVVFSKRRVDPVSLTNATLLKYKIVRTKQLNKICR